MKPTKTEKSKAHPNDANNLPKEEDIHRKIRFEFQISYREYYYECFEGSYVKEFVDFAIKDLQQENARLRQALEKMKLTKTEKIIIIDGKERQGMSSMAMDISKYIKMKPTKTEKALGEKHNK